MFFILQKIIAYAYGMKKWIVGIVCFALVAVGFAVFSKSAVSEENLCYYKQTLVYDEKNHVLEGKEVVGFYNYTDNIFIIIFSF